MIPYYPKYGDPKNPLLFRKIFGTEKNKDILIDFLNDMLTFKEGSPITDVTFLKTVQDPEVAARKTSVADVLCKDQQGHSYVVEMQVAKERGFEKRAQYYAAKAYTAQMKIKGKYEHLKEVVFLAITNFVMFSNKTAYKSDHIILDRDSHEHNLKDFSFTFLELPKLNQSLDQAITMVEKWVHFFKHADEMPEKELERSVKDTHSLYRAYEELNRFSWSEEELQAYEQAEKQEADYIASMDQKYDEGLQEGIEKGLEKGIEKGKLETFQAITLALSLFKGEKSLEEISTETGLSLEELENLKKQIH